MRVEPPTSTTSSISDLLILASLSTFSTLASVSRNRSPQMSSKRARVMEALKSMPSYSESISMVATVDDDSVRFTRSQAIFRRFNARTLVVMSCTQRPAAERSSGEKAVVKRWAVEDGGGWMVGGVPCRTCA